MLLPAYFSRAALTRRTTALFAIGMLLAGATACGDDKKDPVNPNAAVQGTYTMYQIDNDLVPTDIATANQGTLTISVEEGSLVLGNSGTFNLSYTLRFTQGTQQQDDPRGFSGTYSVSGSQITLTTNDGSGTGTIVNGVITFQGVTLIDEAPELEYEVVFKK